MNDYDVIRKLKKHTLGRVMYEYVENVSVVKHSYEIFTFSVSVHFRDIFHFI